jgi:hypothetical protein
MIIENINELDGLSNELVKLRVDDGFIRVSSRFNGEHLDVIHPQNLQDLQKFGINVEYKKQEIKRLRKATLEILECIADENIAVLYRSPINRRWMLKRGDSVFNIEHILEESGYYL